jgi:hypothetical protein
MYQDLIDYKNGTTEQAKIYPEFIPETPLPPLDCDEIKSCVGIDQSGGDPDLVLNQQGIWIPKGGGSSFEYEIGQYVPSEGGVIFHRWLSTTAYGTPSAGTVQNYLVIDTNDISIPNTWWETGNTVVLGLSTWNGQENTDLIIAQATSPLAALYCSQSTNNGKTDWYLPTLFEMQVLSSNMFNVSKGIEDASGSQLVYFGTTTGYWTSTQASNSFAMCFNFWTVAGLQISKTSLSQYLRAARRFSLQP